MVASFFSVTIRILEICTLNSVADNGFELYFLSGTAAERARRGCKCVSSTNYCTQQRRHEIINTKVRVLDSEELITGVSLPSLKDVNARWFSYGNFFFPNLHVLSTYV